VLTLSASLVGDTPLISYTSTSRDFHVVQTYRRDAQIFLDRKAELFIESVLYILGIVKLDDQITEL
jgi:hypothetical protein